MQNLIYALIQLVHNFGAAAIIGIPVYALIGNGDRIMARHRVIIAVGVAWLIQLISGFGFGVASLSFYGHLPDIHGVAIAALLIKITCAIIALAITVLVLNQGRTYPKNRINRFWVIVLILGSVALSSAAFLRWFS